MKVLITGGRGFLGRHFHERLERDGHEVIVVDIIGDPAIDCRDYLHWNRTPFDLVLHLAAVVGGRASIEGRAGLLLEENLSIDAALFRWARVAKPKRVIYFSSSAVYPVRLQEQICLLDEADVDLLDVRSPDQTYGWCKLTGEQLACQAACDGLKVQVFRPFSGYGEDQSLDYPFPSFIDRARHYADPFAIWGSGSQVRDWIHVDDIVGAALASLHEDISGPINLGSGIPISFFDLARAICKQAGYSPTFEVHPEKPNGVWWRCADVTRMREVYQPKVSLEEGIRRALALEA